MCYSKISQEDIKKKMKDGLHKAVDKFCENLIPEKENQVCRSLKELEDNINKASSDTVFAFLENNNQEFTPLLREQQQELRKRVYRRVSSGYEGAGSPGQKPDPEQDSEPEGSHNESPEARKPGESFCEWIQRLFQKMLNRLQKWWQDLLAWLQEKWASFVKTMEFVWSTIKDFCSEVAQFFLSLFQA